MPPSLEPGSPPAPALLAAAEPEAGVVLELVATDPEGVAPCLPEVDAASLKLLQHREAAADSEEACKSRQECRKNDMSPQIGSNFALCPFRNLAVQLTDTFLF